jgi:chorismate mutase
MPKKERPLSPQIVKLRQQIDSIDDGIALLLNDRARQVLAIGDVKRDADLPIYAPDRERAILERLARDNRGPLSNEAIRRLFERVIDESRSLERIYREGSGSQPKQERGS